MSANDARAASVWCNSPPIRKLWNAVGLFCDIVWLEFWCEDLSPRNGYREYGGLELSTWCAERGVMAKATTEGKWRSRVGRLKRGATVVEEVVDAREMFCCCCWWVVVKEQRMMRGGSACTEEGLVFWWSERSGFPTD